MVLNFLVFRRQKQTKKKKAKKLYFKLLQQNNNKTGSNLKYTTNIIFETDTEIQKKTQVNQFVKIKV